MPLLQDVPQNILLKVEAEAGTSASKSAMAPIEGPRKAWLCGERSGGISEARRLRQDERNEARDDEVYNCAL